MAPILLPDLFTDAKIGEADMDDETATIPCQLLKSHDMEDVMNIFEDQMELTILYHFVPSLQTNFGHQCCAYSNVNFGDMYKIHASTNASGLVDTLTVTMYSSMETMCTDLLEDLDRHEGRGMFKYRIPKETILVEFC